MCQKKRTKFQQVKSASIKKRERCVLFITFRLILCIGDVRVVKREFEKLATPIQIGPLMS